MIKLKRPLEPDAFKKQADKEYEKIKSSAADFHNLISHANFKEEPQGYVFMEKIKTSNIAHDNNLEKKGGSFRLEFNDIWKNLDFKRLFITAQNGKCGYCECLTGSPTLDHFRPKAEIRRRTAEPKEIIPKSDYIETPKNTVQSVSPYGYWWLAYEWENYVLSCEVCNEKWKRCQFPLEDEKSRVLPLQPGCELNEKVTLLNPFDDHPQEHLCFSDVGEVSPLTERGRITINTLGLNRGLLKEDRQELCNYLKTFIRYLDADTVDNIARETLELILDMIKPDKKYSGMLQQIFNSYVNSKDS